MRDTRGGEVGSDRRPLMDQAQESEVVHGECGYMSDSLEPAAELIYSENYDDNGSHWRTRMNA